MRTYDLMVFQGVKPTGEALLDPTLAAMGEGGTVATGIQKLAQWFILEFLDERGSNPYFRQGCDFMTELRRGYLRNELAVFTAFSLAVGQITETLQSRELTTDPDDERFVNAELVHLTLTGTTMQLYIRLISRAGDARIALPPIPLPM